MVDYKEITRLLAEFDEAQGDFHILIIINDLEKACGGDRELAKHFTCLYQAIQEESK